MSRARFIQYDTEAERVASIEAQLADILAKGAVRVERCKTKRKAPRKVEAKEVSDE